MNVQIRSKEITLSEANREHINNAIEAYKKFNLEITSVQVVVSKEKNQVAIEFNINIAHHQPIVITQSDSDLNAAIDIAVDRASKALRRMHDKDVSHRDGSIKDLQVEV